jgi:hypothetical protein
MNPPIADHPHTDPGDGRTECNSCGKFVWLVTHSCKRVPVTAAARARHHARLNAGSCEDDAPHLWGIDGRCDTCGVHQDGTVTGSKPPGGES